MHEWSTDELAAIAATGEVDVAPARRDGSLRSFTTIWLVRVDDGLYVRSYNGPGGSWYRAARANGHGRLRSGGDERAVAFREAEVDDDRIDEAYRAKYGRSVYVDAMVADGAAATTLRVVPADG
ncbi:MAG: DUF2255 family protein [Actinomycetota bacterium]|nr:DUF2255 family protein [Actinomycetota bacterium]